MITDTPQTLLLLSIIQRTCSHVKLAKRYKMHLIILVEYINKWTNRTKIKLCVFEKLLDHKLFQMLRHRYCPTDLPDRACWPAFE